MSENIRLAFENIVKTHAETASSQFRPASNNELICITTIVLAATRQLHHHDPSAINPWSLPLGTTIGNDWRRTALWVLLSKCKKG